MVEICKGVQFGVRKTIVSHKSLISYQYTRFPGVNSGIGDLFPCEKAGFYEVKSQEVEQLFT